MREFRLGQRLIGSGRPPFVIAEAGINHNGDVDKAIQLVDTAAECGADCVKFQYHITEEELIESQITPGYLSKERLWDITKRVELTAEEHLRVKKRCDEKGILYLCTPFSREAARRLDTMDVAAFKIGSGECSNLPLLEYIATLSRPIVLSTGMNDIQSVRRAVEVVQKHACPIMLMHCTSVYPTPYDKVRLGVLRELQEIFGLQVGLSDHSPGIYTCLAGVALGASVVEKHFTASRNWPGPDIHFSLAPEELAELVKGTRAVFAALGGRKEVLPDEDPVRLFAFASVVAIRDIGMGDVLSTENVWVKKPGNGEISASEVDRVLGRTARQDIRRDQQLTWGMVGEARG